MPNISKIVTKTGDSGYTSLANGIRITKSHQRIQVIGEIDELNAILGIIISLKPLKSISEIFTAIQRQLFILGSEIAQSHSKRITNSHIIFLETHITDISDHCPPLSNFILPGGTIIAAQIHFARSICRRTERSLVTLAETEDISANVLRYINRLSDLLFLAARKMNQSANYQEQLVDK